jgi:hypothetical protein
MSGEKADDYKQPENKVNVKPEMGNSKRNNDTAFTDEAAQDVWDLLKSHPRLTECPYCKEVVHTHAVRKINVVSAVTCWCCGWCWGLHKLHFKKDPTCWDADHHCSKCKKVVYDYKSC